ncbi:MAG: hypothetical protein KC502_06020 [Myxococcales bacterium]|nr:hypothetical protein [Myxococcales bacterium]
MRVDWDRALDGRDDDDIVSLLWDALDEANDAARVEIIDRIAEFELTPEQARTLLLTAAKDATRIPWVAISILEACGLTALLEAQAEAPDESVIAASSAMVGALVEAALTAGPAGDILDVDEGADVVRALAGCLQQHGATPAEMVVIRLAKRLCNHDNLDVSDEERGWTEALDETLAAAIAAVMAQAPRGSIARDWKEDLGQRVVSGQGPEAVMAWQAALLCEFDVTANLQQRIADAPDDDGTWSVALMAIDRKVILDDLAPLSVAALQHRRMREGELCSPASQAGCDSCGSPDGAEDDELMVPKALEARVLPVLVHCALHPGEHADLLCETLAAPSVALRYNSLAVLQRWPISEIDAEIWEVVEALSQDSVPQVKEAVGLLLAERNKPAD